MFGQVYQIKIGPDNSIKILDWITIVKISDLLNTKVYTKVYVFCISTKRSAVYCSLDMD